MKGMINKISEVDYRPYMMMILTVALFGASQDVLALAAPSSGDAFYEVYDIVVNNVIGGPIGYSIAAVSAAFTAGMVITSKLWPAVGGGIGTAILIASDSIVTSMGAIII